MSEVPPSKDMAEEGVSQQHIADLKDDKTHPTSSGDSAACDEHKPPDLPVNVNQQSSNVSDSSSSSLIGEAESNNGEGVEQAVGRGACAEKKMAPPTEKSSGEDDSREKSSPPESDEESHGDHKRNKEPPSKADAIPEDHDKEEKKARATGTLSADDRQEDQPDGTKTATDEESSATNQTSADAGEGEDAETTSASEEVKETSDSTASPEPALLQNESLREELDDQEKDVETIGPTTQEIPEPKVQGGIRRYLAAVCIVAFVAILVQHLLLPEPQPQKKDVRQIDVFLKQMEKVKTGFPNQRAELWTRARIHLQRHLLTAQPTEPVSLILTAGLRAERTLHCLAQGLASAFSAALNASVLHIDGASKASEDSDQVKLDIDSKLQGAFEGDKPVAIIHRFEELPPGSTLIFYRYCDHENAAYKKTFLIFTVLLGEEEEIPAKIRLSVVEEMVDDHLQKKFLTHGHPVSFDRMDLDKYGGLWSRISHLILPVAAEERIEHEGC
ncbi:torsin-1A-interacting protein 2-like isoform X2 [Acanthochromis polyacanthus]|uniref:torsin-1A-interacting protein 2-like isoform X2 n=1 Tax=Acanthochromis polyacanthus TaxID=80966 RepID=UPI0022347630|nr:torsin-1A-interacting protein 2-like isoform X2 [Acanthochromis polyacanthus]